MFRRFKLLRKSDISGVSGTGYVAEGCVFTSGKAILVWYGEHSSTNVYENIQEVEFIHGHHGSTLIEWLDKE